MQKAMKGPWVAALLVTTLNAAVLTGRQTSTLPAGTRIRVRLLSELDTGMAEAGQKFSATVAGPVVVGGRSLVSRGTQARGRVVEAVSSGRLKRPASITLELTDVGSNALLTEPLRVDGKSHLLRNAAIIGGESAAGAIVGAAVAGRKGAAIGAATGAGAGVVTAYMTGKKEIVLPSETTLTFVVAGSTPPPAAAARPEPPARQAESPYFSGDEQGLIRQYFATNTAGLPPGLAKRGGRLPPGLEKHLRRNGTLPPGLQKRVQPFPVALSRQLSPLPRGYVRVILSNRALIVDVHNRILDVMFIHQSRGGRYEGEDD